MKALVFENKVTQVAHQEFPVHKSLKWVECDENVKPGYQYDGQNFIEPVVAVGIPVETPNPYDEIRLKLQSLYKAIKDNDTSDADVLFGP